MAASSPAATVGSELPPEPGGSGGPGEGADEERELLLARLVPASRLKEAVGASLASLFLGPFGGAQRLGTLVDCLVLNYRLRQGPARARERGAEGPLRCCGCGRFLGEPVTVPCGHTYCRRCLRRELRARCRRCRDWLLPAGGTSTAAAPLRTSVVLNRLAEKWFPGECERTRAGTRLEELLTQGRFREALGAVNQALRADSGDLMLRIYRAESYVGLQEYKTAIEDLNFVISKMPNWPEVYFQKGKVLHDSGFVGDALQLFLQCLALDEDFLPAKLEVEKILCDVLSPEKLGESLKESAWNSPHIRNKPFILGSEVTASYCNLQLCPPQSLGGSDVLEPVSGGLNRAQSAHALNSTKDLAKEDGLKRVSSEPLLSGQGKGALLKRKLSFSEQDTVVCEDGRNKHKKQGESTKRDIGQLAFGTIPGDLIDVSDFECSLCMRLFFEPVTTPCGHTFCKGCLERCLDHAPQCPLCKESLKEYLASRKYSITELLEELIMKYLSDELFERKRIHAEETAEHSNLTKNVPMFVCTMAYPTVPCPLHVFEPRYRLMIRRSMETGTKQFGMCISDSQNGFADYGCMLQIRNVHFLPDGRSVVDTIGGKRFRVLRRGMKDGYCTADIEYLEDVKVADEELKKLRELHNFVYNQACSWFQNLRNKFRTQILQHFGPMPDREENIQAMPNGPAWCWWLLAVLPVDPRYQLSVLSMMSLKDRLIKIQHILTYFSRDQSK
ncbi:LON peptidase N-terminal domain and RING finger protein 1 [Camarhynchus parvulus]|uniref:LON peptidase N-terminal domain and ring finger 1 n=1 Tax=Geospiza parvula TaxID=87175 RepID=A0A8C3MQR4_GEOPR|nr:LON peptidase N-terminal domain and RING finger protein 1 [Camarhynchus parvulus]